MDCENCENEATFWVSEQYIAADGLGAVERLEAVCTDCVDDVEPEGIERPYGRYEFKIEAVPEAFGMGRVE